MPQSHYSWRMNPQYYQNSSPVTEPKVQYYIRENGSLKYFVKVTDSTSNVFTMWINSVSLCKLKRGLRLTLIIVKIILTVFFFNFIFPHCTLTAHGECWHCRHNTRIRPSSVLIVALGSCGGIYFFVFVCLYLLSFFFMYNKCVIYKGHREICREQHWSQWTAHMIWIACQLHIAVQKSVYILFLFLF